MIFNENKFRLIPQSKYVVFDLQNLYLNNSTGVAEIGVSGQGQMLCFSFVSGRILDPQKRFIGSYRPDEETSIRAELSDNVYRYYIDSGLFCDGESKNSIVYKYFFVNVTGCSLSVNPYLYAPQPNVSIQFENEFRAGTFATGRVVNNSDISFQIFDSSYIFKNGDKPSFNKRISGAVSGNASFGFQLPDITSGALDGPVPFTFNLETSYGGLTSDFVLNRVSGVTGNFLISGIFDFINTDVLTPFTGLLTGGAQNCQFLFVKNSELFEDQQIVYEAYNSNGSEISKTFKCQLSPIFPSGYSATFTGDFITGARVTNSGIYQQFPDLEFISYYSIKNIDFAINNLFSSGCRGAAIPISFLVSSGLGTGASGEALLKPVSLNIYGNNTFYTITGINMFSGGTGYNYAPSVVLNTGSIASDCFDVSAVSGNQYIYAPFSGSAIMNPLASYLFAEAFYNTGVTGFVTGVEYVYIQATGIEITNIGSGYNSVYLPKMVFHRKSDDIFNSIAIDSGLNASGQFYLNASGQTVQFSGIWRLCTGENVDSLTDVPFYQGTGYSGEALLSSTSNSVLFRTFYIQTTNNNPIQSKLSLLLQDNSLFSCMLRGVNIFNKETGYLKVIQEPSGDAGDIDFFN
jgi:hypothetical protein